MTPTAKGQPDPENTIPKPTPDLGVPDRYRGCLLGSRWGDGLGTTLEFRRPGSFEPIDDMVGGGPFRLQPGQMDRRHVDGALPRRNRGRSARERSSP